MRIELLFTPHQTDEMGLRDKVVVAIDVLRASTTIITALRNGARGIIPVATVESAVKISGNLAGDITLLGGERHGKMIEGFHLGNSPLEYTEEKVRGKSIVFSSTNGSQAFAKGRFARDLVICGFANVSTVAHFLLSLGRDCTIVCAGNNGAFSLEDSVCAGMLVGILSDKADDVVLTDGALAARALCKSLGRSVLKMLRNTDHGRYLQEIGFGADLAACAAVDTIPVLPQMDGNMIRLKTL